MFWGISKNEWRRKLKRVVTKYKPKRIVRKYNMPEHLLENPYQDMSEWQKAYIAGIIDGEGCIQSSYPKSRRFVLKITIGMTHKPTMEWLSSIFGARAIEQNRYNPNMRRNWYIALPAARAGHLLKTIYPYMLTKQEEADVAIQIWDTLWCKRVSRLIPEDILELRNQLGQRLRDLKRVEWK